MARWSPLDIGEGIREASSVRLFTFGLQLRNAADTNQQQWISGLRTAVRIGEILIRRLLAFFSEMSCMLGVVGGSLEQGGLFEQLEWTRLLAGTLGNLRLVSQTISLHMTDVVWPIFHSHSLYLAKVYWAFVQITNERSIF